MREAGELRRRDISPLALALTPGVEAVWDGRFVFCADRLGWSVVPARGRLASLSDTDRAEINRLPAATRGAWPVLIRDDAVAPVLAGEGVERRGLVAERLRLALDETTHEDDLIAPPWRNAAEAPIFGDRQSRPWAQSGPADDRGPQ